MTHAEKVRKLSNAIRRYRGIHNPKTGHWITGPQPKERDSVMKWIGEIRSLKFESAKNIELIDGFKTIPEFHKWITTI